jgi:hypothetical protein
MKEEEAPEGEGLEDEATEDADSIVAEETEEPTEE